jgi:cytosine/uracil/thiamine/allantoin permease
MPHLREDGYGAELANSDGTPSPKRVRYKSHPQYAMVWLGVFVVCVWTLCLTVIFSSLSTESVGLKVLAGVTLVGFLMLGWYAKPRH